MNLEEEKYKTSIDFKIKTYDIDAAGHVNNIVYIKWLEDLRVKLFEQLLPISTLLYLNLYPVVISTNIVYKKQLKLSDKPSGYVCVQNIMHNMMMLKFNFTIDKKVCAVAEQKCVLMNLKNSTMDKEKLKSMEKEK